MNLKFDHLVHLTKSPEEAKKTFTSLGFQAFKGGHHLKWGTYNYLCFFPELRYIEWIGFHDIFIAKSSINPLIQQIVKDSENGEGFSQIAFRTNNIKTLQHILEKKGFETIGPFDGSRMKEDGKPLRWSMLFLKEENNDIRYPFFIEWGEKDDTRKNQLATFMHHQNGTPSLSYIGYFVNNAKETIQKYATILGCDVTSVQEKVDRFGSYLDLSIDNFSLRFYEHKKENVENKPIICGITGIPEEKSVQVHGGIYLFTK